MTAEPKVWAVADLHLGRRGSDTLIDKIMPTHPQDWLILAGDIADKLEELFEFLSICTERFETVIWVPGNHELWSTSYEGIELAGERLYQFMVRRCQELGVLTPEDEFPLWQHNGQPTYIVPLFTLYDYSWTVDPDHTTTQALAAAKANRVVASDEYFITPQRHANISSWCAQRLRYSTSRLAHIDVGTYPTVLVNHWPLRREPTEVLHHPDFALWCGSDHTRQWHLRYNASVCVYGHLHIPRTTYYDGVRFEECSAGYSSEWRRRGIQDPLLRQILPATTQEQVLWHKNEHGKIVLNGKYPGGQDV